MMMLVWTEAYSPWIMGGDVHAPLGAMLEVGNKFDLGQGQHGYLIQSPTGELFVAEATTGAFIGPSLEQVREDVASCDDISVMEKQLEAAKLQREKVRVLEPEDFWSRFK